MIGTELQKGQLGLYTLCIVVATLAIVCRLWARKVTGTTWQLNDYLMIIAWLNAIGLAMSANLAVVNGEMGVHQAQIPKERADEIYPFNMKMTMVIPFFLITSSFFVKMSITHFYIQLFPHTFLIRLCQIQLPLLLACWIGIAIPCFLMCRPISYLWDLNVTGTCFDIQGFWLGSSIVALYFDLLCVALPIPVVWGLRCSVSKKLKLTLLFGLGFFICIITGLRIAKADTVNFTDLTWSAAPAVMCSVPEPTLSIVAGCFPICMPLVKRASKPIRSFLRLPSRPPTPLPAPSADMVDLEAAKRKPSLPLSEAEKLKRLQDHLYPMSSIVISTNNGSVGMSPMSPTQHTGLSPNPYGVRSPSIYEEVYDGFHGNEGFREWTEIPMGDPVHWNGIQVTREVHVNSMKRESLARMDWNGGA